MRYKGTLAGFAGGGKRSVLRVAVKVGKEPTSTDAARGANFGFTVEVSNSILFPHGIWLLGRDHPSCVLKL